MSGKPIASAQTADLVRMRLKFQKRDTPRNIFLSCRMQWDLQLALTSNLRKSLSIVGVVLILVRRCVPGWYCLWRES